MDHKKNKITETVETTDIIQTHRCRICGKVLPVTDFYWDNRRNRPGYYCKSCRNEKSKENYQKEKERYAHSLDELKKNNRKPELTAKEKREVADRLIEKSKNDKLNKKKKNGKVKGGA